MSVMHAFDTLAFAKKLKNAGYSDGQAEALTEALAEAQAEVFREMLKSSLATKPDIQELKEAIQADIQRLKEATQADIQRLREATQADFQRLREATQADIQELRDDIRRLESSMDKLGLQLTIRMGGMMVVLSGVLLAAIRFM
ncbi:coiled-coil domain-containing protein [uncultured Halomonas sp.]|uniref:coiled-coil domain-containing protein n=1 Tax=uncultured Halomonas sp. TaxID=173971 RepID=UPI00260D15E0|nr:coiled-coil domain-containing protein [uncultured Halomonas sp.]